MTHISERAAYSPHPTLPDGVLTVCIKVAETEIRALRDDLKSAGFEIAAQDPSFSGASPEAAEADPRATLSTQEMCARFLCMIVGGALVAAGLAGGLPLGLFESPLFGLCGASAALAGAALCIGGLMLGQPKDAMTT